MLTNVARNTLTPLLLRLMLAAIFIFHGLSLVSGEGHQWGANWNPALPVPAQLAVAWGQLVGGIALALGLLTRLAAVGIIVIMAGAIATVHWPHGFSMQNGGFEYNAAIIVMCLCLVLGGPGRLPSTESFGFSDVLLKPRRVDWRFDSRGLQTGGHNET